MSRFSYPVIKVVYDRRKTATKADDANAKPGPVEIEIYHDRRRKWIATGIKTYRNYWYGAAPYYIRGCADGMMMSLRITDIVARLQTLITDLCRTEEFSFSRLDEALRVRGEREQKFTEYIRARMDEKESSGEIRHNTWRSMNTLLNHVIACGRLDDFDDLTPGNIQRFDEYLHREGLRQTSIHKMHKRLKSVISECCRKGIARTNPYVGFRIKAGSPEPKRYLTEEEMEKVRRCLITDRKTSRVRDLAVFQMFTGLAYADLMAFDRNKLEMRGDSYFLRDNRIKSNEQFCLLLLSPAVEVLRKYDFRLPHISNQKYNAYLKELADVCGIPPFSSHDLRRTFATYALSKGLSIEIIARMMGHSDIRQTQEYARLVGKDVEDAMRRLDMGV